MTGPGSHRGSYFMPRKITTSKFVYPKISLLYLAYPKKFLSPFFSTQKNPCFFSRPIKIQASFMDPPKSLLANISDPKISFGHPPPSPTPVIKICEWGPTKSSKFALIGTHNKLTPYIYPLKRNINTKPFTVKSRKEQKTSLKSLCIYYNQIINQHISWHIHTFWKLTYWSIASSNA